MEREISIILAALGRRLRMKTNIIGSSIVGVRDVSVTVAAVHDEGVLVLLLHEASVDHLVDDLDRCLPLRLLLLQVLDPLHQLLELLQLLLGLLLLLLSCLLVSGDLCLSSSPLGADLEHVGSDSFGICKINES